MYSLTNISSEIEEYLWAMHPLFRLREGDELILPSEMAAEFADESWLPSLSAPADGCAKKFARTGREAEVTLRNRSKGESLTIRWEGDGNPFFGLWLTRGGWHGHHHLALEPTNACDDSLADAVQRGCFGRLHPGMNAGWSVEMEFSHS